MTLASSIGYECGSPGLLEGTWRVSARCAIASIRPASRVSARSAALRRHGRQRRGRERRCARLDARRVPCSVRPPMKPAHRGAALATCAPPRSAGRRGKNARRLANARGDRVGSEACLVLRPAPRRPRGHSGASGSSRSALLAVGLDVGAAFGGGRATRDDRDYRSSRRLRRSSRSLQGPAGPSGGLRRAIASS